MVDHEGNAEVDGRGGREAAAGVSGKLLAHALADAAERGNETTTLIATQLGFPVYERAGFRPLGRRHGGAGRRLD